ncbi:DUF4307 domain-containing protein [Actinoplanes sp. NPDC026670]|uniref:DUF4307 domain-containing protein n=1 Tax=Actinoplanes sp. NPDC026670 TaxID=3154700 RepID=UPI0033E5A0AB
MSETHATAPVFPPGRYGRRREGGRRRLAPVLAVAIFAVVISGITYAYYDKFGQTDYTADIIGWSIPSDTEMVVEFRVRVPAGGAAMCMVRARDYDGYEVGRQAVTVRAADGGGAVEVSQAVTTESKASVGDVMGCRATG